MEYFVLTNDGKQFGPANLDLLKQWAGERRLGANTMLRDAATGRVLMASSVPGLFSVQAPPPPVYGGNPIGQNVPPSFSSQPRSGTRQYTSSGGSDVAYAFVISTVGVALAFAVGTIGILCIGGLMAAIRAQSKGHRLGVVAIVYAALTVVIVALRLAVRFRAF